MKKRAVSGTTEIKKTQNLTKLKRENFSTAEDSKKLYGKRLAPKAFGFDSYRAFA
jgi:hypothetical protein